MTKIINVGEGAGNSYIFRSGVRLQVTPEGDCREATFIARGNGINLNPLDAVQINVNGVPTFYGEVRVGGNPYDIDGHQFTIRSMALRLKEVVLPQGWSAPKQAAHLTIQSMINAVLPQLGGAINGTSISDLGFDCRPITNANQQNPYALLEQIASDGEGLGVKVRFGVNASGQFFTRPAKTDSTALTHDMLTGATHWVAPVAETPCTAVLWYVAKKPDGNWLTHLSQAPEAAVYGVRVKPVSLVSSEGVWKAADVNASVSAGAQAKAYPNNNLNDSTNNIQDAVPRLLTERLPGEPSFASAVVFLPADSAATELSLTLSGNADRVVISGNSALFNRTNPPQGELYTPPVEAELSISFDGQEDKFPGTGRAVFYRQVSSVKLSVDLTKEPAPSTEWSPLLYAHEVRLETLDTALLDRLAKFHYNIPATAPADIEIKGFFQDRTGFVTYNGWQSPVDAWEIRVSADRGINVGVLAGQADDPNKLAQAELIKARDGRAVITAVISKE